MSNFPPVILPPNKIFSTTSDLLSAFGADVVLEDGTVVVTGGRDAANDGGGGTFRYDSEDTSTADNGGSARVDDHGRRFKLVSGSTLCPSLFKGASDTDDTAFTNMFDAVAAGVRSNAYTLFRHYASHAVCIPAGDYAIGEGHALGGSPSDVAWGLELSGDGIASNIYFYPGTTDTFLFTADKYSRGQIRNMAASSGSAHGSFLKINTVTADGKGSFGYSLRDLTLFGEWDIGVGIYGDDLGSDMEFENVTLWGGIKTAFFYTPSIGSTVQAKNYTFKNCQWTYVGTNRAPIVDISIGGNITGIGGNAVLAASLLFALRQSAFLDTYSHGDFQFEWDGFELEPAGNVDGLTPDLKVMLCNWPAGNVTWRNFNGGTAQTGVDPAQVLFDFVLNYGGPSVTFDGGQVPGVTKYTAPAKPHLYSYSIEHRGVTYHQNPDIFTYGQESVQIAHDPGDSDNLAYLPVVKLRGCRAGTPTNNSFYVTPDYPVGAAVASGDFAVISGMRWKSFSDGTAAATAPNFLRSETVTDSAGIVWQPQDSYPYSSYVTDANVKYPGVRPACALDALTTIYVDGDGGLPQGDDASIQHFVRKILPPNHWIVRARLVIPVGATAQSTTATFILQTEEYTPTVIHTFAVTDPSAGTDVTVDLDFSTGAGAAIVTSDFGKRVISLVSQSDVTAAIPGAYLELTDK